MKQKVSISCKGTFTNCNMCFGQPICENEKPKLDRNEYNNRKGNVYSTCDTLEGFTSLSKEWPSSVQNP